MPEFSRHAVLALVPLLVLFVVLGIDFWLYTDAKERARQGRPVVFASGGFVVDTPEAWLVGSLLLWIVFVPLYLSSRNR